MVLSYLENRALTAYLRAGAREVAEYGGGSVTQPGEVKETEHDGLRYVYLANVNGILAVYRIRVVDGEPVLKRLKRWPAGFAESLDYTPQNW